MLHRINLLVCMLLISAGITAQNPDVPINPNLTFNGEQSLAIDPNNSAHMVVAWMKYQYFPTPATIMISVSTTTNGGSTWSNPVNLPHFRPHWYSADPTLAYKSDGTLFLGYIDYKLNHDSGAVYVSKSTDGGLSWGTMNEVVNATDSPDLIIDRPWLAIDNSGGSNDGRLYMVTMSIEEDPPPHHIYCCNSADGITWSSPVLVDNDILVGPSVRSMGIPTVTKDGKLMIGYFSYSPSQSLLGRFICGISTDGGSTITNSVITTVGPTTITNDTLLQYSYRLCANPSNSTNLIFLFVDKSNSDYDSYSTFTNDGGITWSTSQRINSDPVNNGNNQDMLWGNFSQSGKFAAVWRDRRANTGAQDQPYKIWGAYSLDGGANYSPDFRISQTDGPLMMPVDGNDFMGCVLSDSTINVTWTDKRNSSTNQLFFNKISFAQATGINEINSTINSIDIFPNPNDGSFTIKSTLQGIHKILIMDLSGREIYRMEFAGAEQIVKTDLPAGEYILQISSAGNSVSKKMIISK